LTFSRHDFRFLLFSRVDTASVPPLRSPFFPLRRGHCLQFFSMRTYDARVAFRVSPRSPFFASLSIRLPVAARRFFRSRNWIPFLPLSRRGALSFPLPAVREVDFFYLSEKATFAPPFLDRARVLVALLRQRFGLFKFPPLKQLLPGQRALTPFSERAHDS